MASDEAPHRSILDEEKQAQPSTVSSNHSTTKDDTTVADPDAAAAPKPPVNPFMDPESFPDRGSRAWSVVFGGFFALFVSFGVPSQGSRCACLKPLTISGWINCVGVFQDYYQTHQLKSFSPSAISWIPTMETFMMFAGDPIIGKFYDRYGPRYIMLLGRIKVCRLNTGSH